jgi:hypothetical protein
MKYSARKYYERKVIPFQPTRGSRYPNSADRQYRMNRMIDLALTGITCLGAITTLVFLAFL